MTKTTDKNPEVLSDAELAANVEQPKPIEQWPFLKIPAEQGGVIIGTDERESTQVMTPADIGAAHEQMFFVATQLREAAATEKELALEEKRIEGALKGCREALRKIETKQLEIGRELATYAEEVHTGVRKVTIQVVETITLQNEFVITDARDGSVIDRRTATAEELEDARSPGKNQTGLFGSSDSPDPKATPGDARTLISINAGAYKKAKKSVKSALLDVHYPNSGDDDDLYPVAWMINPDDTARSIATVPAWAAHRLKLIAENEKALDFRIEPAPVQSTAPAAN